MIVCAFDGIPLGTSRAGKLVHLAELPQETPEHLPSPTEHDEHEQRLDNAERLALAATDMLVHHAMLHPETGCTWAANLERALKTA